MVGGGAKAREIGTVALALAAALLSLRHSARNQGELQALDRGILVLVRPAQAAFSSVMHGVADFAERYVDLVHVRSDNETLKSENTKLRAELMEARRLAAESSRYQRLLGLRDQTPAETLAARVIAIDASPYFRVARVEIDRGEGLVRHGMPVLTPEGVVGRIAKVSGATADILLAVDPRSAIDVIVPRTGGRGILRGKAGENGYRCTVEYLVRGEPAKVGDEVVTSGLGGAFPRDLPVGRVSKVVQSNVGLYQDVEVAPAVNYARLGEVLVVVAPPPSPDPEAGTRRPASPTRGVMVYR